MREEFVENEIQLWLQEYKEGVHEYEQKMPDVVRAYHDFTGACFAEGALDKKAKHLVALGIGIFSQDEYCMIYHTQEALHAGASEQEILEVVAVCAAYGGGFAMSQGVTIIQECLEQLRPKH